MVSVCIGGKKSKNKQTSSASKACWIFFYVTSVFDWSGGIFPLKPAHSTDITFYNVIVMVFIGYSLDCSSVIWVNGLCDIISKLISSNKAHQSSMWGGWTMLSSFAGCLRTLWQSCQACCVCVCVYARRKLRRRVGGIINPSPVSALVQPKSWLLWQSGLPFSLPAAQPC